MAAGPGPPRGGKISPAPCRTPPSQEEPPALLPIGSAALHVISRSAAQWLRRGQGREGVGKALPVLRAAGPRDGHRLREAEGARALPSAASGRGGASGRLRRRWVPSPAGPGPGAGVFSPLPRAQAPPNGPG